MQLRCEPPTTVFTPFNGDASITLTNNTPNAGNVTLSWTILVSVFDWSDCVYGNTLETGGGGVATGPVPTVPNLSQTFTQAASSGSNQLTTYSPTETTTIQVDASGNLTGNFTWTDPIGTVVTGTLQATLSQLK